MENLQNKEFWVPLLEGLDICSTDYLVYKRFLGLRIKKQLPSSLNTFMHELENHKMNELEGREAPAIFSIGQSRCLLGHVFHEYSLRQKLLRQPFWASAALGLGSSGPQQLCSRHCCPTTANVYFVSSEPGKN